MTVTVTPRRIAALAAAALAGAALTLAVRSGGTPAAAAVPIPTTASAGGSISTGIQVSGTGTVAGTPDALRLDLTVSATGSTVTDALRSANAATTRVQRSLTGHGVAAKDVQTSGLSISPEYGTKAGAPVIHDYRVDESMTATLHGITAGGQAIGAAVAAGGNAVRVDGISLDLTDTSALVTSARGRAFADARAKADQYARAAGRTLGSVVGIDESVSAPTPMPIPAFARAAAAGSPVPVQAGSEDVAVTVTVTFAFG